MMGGEEDFTAKGSWASRNSSVGLWDLWSIITLMQA